MKDIKSGFYFKDLKEEMKLAFPYIVIGMMIGATLTHAFYYIIREFRIGIFA
jgi:hypothetical protein